MIAAKAIHIPQERVRVFQRKLYRAAKVNPKRKFGVLYDKVYSFDLLWQAWLDVKANRGSAGIDHETIKDIEEYGVNKLLLRVSELLRGKKYKPQAVLRVYISKSDGRKRPLGIPTVADRVVQTATKYVIEPIFEADFADFSYGFRPKRSAHNALREIYKWLNFGCKWVVDADLSSYFDTIPHDKLMWLVQERINDKSVLKLLKMWLKAGVLEEGKIKPTDLGTPQGGVVSPLLANIYLNALDRFWVNNGYGTNRNHDAHIVRYADDFVILCHHDPNRYFDLARSRLDRLSLTINKEKTRIVDAIEGFNFLGHTFIRGESRKNKQYKTYYYPSDKAMKSVKAKVKEITTHSSHLDMPDVVETLNPILRGWGNYFKTGNAKEHFDEIDHYIMRNLTIMLRKKHKKRSKGWREHPPSWFYDYHKLICLRKMCTNIDDDNKRYKRG
jgi:Retron-type reverse transcriptase